MINFVRMGCALARIRADFPILRITVLLTSLQNVDGGSIFLLTTPHDSIPSMGDTTQEWLQETTMADGGRRAR